MSADTGHAKFESERVAHGALVGRLKQLIGNSAIYVVGSFMTAGLGLLLLPIYTRVLTPAGYGVLGITTAVSSLAVPILSWSFLSAVMRFYVEFENQERERKGFLGTLLTFQVVTSGLLVLGLNIIGQNLLISPFRQVPFNPFIVLALWIAYFESLFMTVPYGVLLIKQRPLLYVSLNSLYFLLNIGLTVFAVVWMRLGALGALQARLIAALVMAFVFNLVIIKQVRLNFSYTQLIAALTLCLPIIAHSLAQWLLSVSDRVLLARWVDLSEIGVYILGFQIGWAVLMVNVAMNSAWMPFFFRAAGVERDRDLIPRFATYFVLVIAVVCLGIVLFGPDVIHLIASPQYQGATQVVLWVALSGLAYGLYLIWADAIIYSKRTILLPLATVLAGIVNVGLNVYFIPIFGIMAAAVNNLIGYSILALLVYLLSKRLFPIRHQYSRWIKIGTTLGMLVIVSQIVVLEPWLLNVALKLVLLSLFPFVLYIFGFFEVEERRVILGVLQTGKSHFKGKS